MPCKIFRVRTVITAEAVMTDAGVTCNILGGRTIGGGRRIGGGAGAFTTVCVAICTALVNFLLDE